MQATGSAAAAYQSKAPSFALRSPRGNAKKGMSPFPVRNRLKDSRGFTLIEMLIVVAIIAILIMVSIPMVNGALERVRHTADQANERAAKAAAYMVYYFDALGPAPEDDEVRYFYDADTGTLIQVPNGAFNSAQYTPYGKCSVHNHADQYLWVMINWKDGTVKMGWGKSLGGTSGGGVKWDTNCSLNPLS